MRVLIASLRSWLIPFLVNTNDQCLYILLYYTHGTLLYSWPPTHRPHLQLTASRLPYFETRVLMERSMCSESEPPINHESITRLVKYSFYLMHVNHGLLSKY